MKKKTRKAINEIMKDGWYVSGFAHAKHKIFTPSDVMGTVTISVVGEFDTEKLSKLFRIIEAERHNE